MVDNVRSRRGHRSTGGSHSGDQLDEAGVRQVKIGCGMMESDRLAIRHLSHSSLPTSASSPMSIPQRSHFPDGATYLEAPKQDYRAQFTLINIAKSSELNKLCNCPTLGVWGIET